MDQGGPVCSTVEEDEKNTILDEKKLEDPHCEGSGVDQVVLVSQDLVTRVEVFGSIRDRNSGLQVVEIFVDFGSYKENCVVDFLLVRLHSSLLQVDCQVHLLPIEEIEVCRCRLFIVQEITLDLIEALVLCVIVSVVNGLVVLDYFDGVLLVDLA